MDGEIGGIESLLEDLIWGLSGDQMRRDKPSEFSKEPRNRGAGSGGLGRVSKDR